jgi:hypothetical protein
MPIHYTLEGKKFTLSYSELKQKYIEFCEMDDATFLLNINDALHLAVIICYLKELPAYRCLSDTGIIHELVHLLSPDPVVEVKKVRREFKRTLKLS